MEKLPQKVLEKLEKVDTLQKEIEAFGEFPEDIRKKINYKFRLEWNYHSNSMEGNTLTMEETRSVMVNNLTVEGKPLRDVLEMRGHDSMVIDILNIGKGTIRLSEKRIKDIHKAIISEDEPDKQKLIGKWKEKPNYLYNYRNERFDFTHPTDVAEAMHELLNNTNAAIDAIEMQKKDAPHPVMVAFSFHLDYVSIHPFYDGNGRTARLLSNLILIALGYPPIIIKTQEKDSYGRYLADIQAYGGKADLFYGFLLDKLIDSQELVLSALHGEDIDDLDDVDKEIALLKTKTASKATSSKKNFTLVGLHFRKWISPLLQEVQNKHKKIGDLFLKSNSWFDLPGKDLNLTDEYKISLLYKDTIDDSETLLFDISDDTVQKIIFNYNHENFKSNRGAYFNIIGSIVISFESAQIVITADKDYRRVFTYDNILSEKEWKELASDLLKIPLAEIKSLTADNNLK